MNLKSLGVFAMGSAFGALCAWLGVKRYYEEKADKAIADVKAVYTYKKNDDGTTITPEEEQKIRLDKMKDNLKEAQNAIDIVKYHDYSANFEDEEEAPVPVVDPAESESPKDDDSEQDPSKPYQIDAALAGYGRSCVACTYFAADGILADNDSMPNAFDRLEIDKTIGEEGLKECLDIWEDSPEEAVYFRNEKLGLDFEVLKTDTNYNEYVRAYNGVTDS